MDANLGQPDLTRRIAPRATAGLDGLVLSASTGADLPEAMLTPSLSFVPAVAGVVTGRKADPNAFLGTQAMRSALSRLSARRDVILDLPALDASPDAQAIGAVLTGVVLVATLNRTKLDQLSEAIRALHSADTRVLGIVLNDPMRFRKARRLARATASAECRTSPNRPRCPDSMRVGVFNVKYSPNLGDGLLSECLEAELVRAIPGLSIASFDLAGRTDYGAGGRFRGAALSLLQSSPTPVRQRVASLMLGRAMQRLAPTWRERLADVDVAVTGGGNLFSDADLNFP